MELHDYAKKTENIRRRLKGYGEGKLAILEINGLKKPETNFMKLELKACPKS